MTKNEEAEEVGKLTERIEGVIQNFKYNGFIMVEDRELYHHVGSLGTMNLGYLSGELFDAAEIRSKRGR